MISWLQRAVWAMAVLTLLVSLGIVGYALAR